MQPQLDTTVRRSDRWLIRYPRALPVAIFVFIAAITLLSVFIIERGEAQQQRARLYETAQDIASSLERRASASSSYLRAGAALFATMNDRVSASLFRRFVGELRLDSAYRGAEGIGWAEVVPVSALPAFENRIDGEVPGELHVHPRPGSGREMAVPVTFLLPDSLRSRRALGYDMFSEPTRREAMAAAIRDQQPTASGRVMLVQERRGRASGFLIYMPVFGLGPDGARVKGFIYSPYNAANLLASVIGPQGEDRYGVRLYDGPPQPAQLMASLPQRAFDGPSVTREIELANRVMTIAVTAPRDRMLSFLSMITLIFGLAVASLSMLIARLLTQQAFEDQASLAFFAEQNSIRDSLTRELNHRVKNTLANVLSIASLTRRRATSMADYADGLEGRIRALSATHDLLTQSEWGTTPIRTVIEAEMAPYVGEGHGALSLEGPHVELAPSDALTFGLAIHELATNAAKYGALSIASGRVKVEWSLVRDDLARIHWCELGGPVVPTSRARGFGTDLLEKIVAHELKHPVQLEFEPEGVRCEFRVPVRRPSEFRMRARSRR